MAVTFTAERGETASTANASTYTVATFTPTAGSLLVAMILGVDSAATFSLSSINGTGLTWTDMGLNALRDNGTSFFDGEIWWASTDGSATGTITLTWSEAIIQCVVWIGEFAGANMTTPIPQTAKDEAGTTDPNVSLGSAPAAGSLCVAAYMGFVDANQVAEAGWNSQLAVDTLTAPVTGFGVWVSDSNDQTFTAAGTDGNHYSMIAEIQQAAAAAVLPPLPTIVNDAVNRSYNW